MKTNHSAIKLLSKTADFFWLGRCHLGTCLWRSVGPFERELVPNLCHLELLHFGKVAAACFWEVRCLGGTSSSSIPAPNIPPLLPPPRFVNKELSNFIGQSPLAELHWGPAIQFQRLGHVPQSRNARLGEKKHMTSSYRQQQKWNFVGAPQAGIHARSGCSSKGFDYIYLKKHALNLNGCNRGSPRTVAINPDLGWSWRICSPCTNQVLVSQICCNAI